MNIPSQYMPVMPYIIVQDAEGFQAFMHKVFGATVQLIVPAEGTSRGIMHGEVRIGPAVIMFAGATPEWPEKTCGMFIYVDAVQKVYDLALANGAQSLVPVMQKDYGLTGGFNDPFGNQWWVTQAN